MYLMYSLLDPPTNFETTNPKSKKEDFGSRGHLTDYLPTLRGQSWTFD